MYANRESKQVEVDVVLGFFRFLKEQDEVPDAKVVGVSFDNAKLNLFEEYPPKVKHVCNKVICKTYEGDECLVFGSNKTKKAKKKCFFLSD